MILSRTGPLIWRSGVLSLSRLSGPATATAEQHT
jgi:hypothetical protein